MNTLTNRQRKLAYFGGILLLMIPIVFLGMPGSPDGTGKITGGTLAKIRHEHKLGEATLGEVDPSSSAMNLVLLGFRGVAASMLNIQSIDYFRTKNWGKFLGTVDSVVNLQPHFHKVWSFQGWNIAYNVSSQWDGVEDRYWWVKRGAKFLHRGTAINEDIPDLEWYRGQILGNKIGNSDEWKFFRRFFNPEGYPEIAVNKKGDPDRVRWNGGPDRDLNPLSEDNYLVARRAYLAANDKETRTRQRVMARILFRSMPSHALISLAQTLQKEGVFNEAIARRWSQAHDSWVNAMGQDEFYSFGGMVRLEMTESELRAIGEEEGIPYEDKVKGLESSKSIVNYNYWKTFSFVESLPATTAVHRRLYEGKELFKSGQVSPDGHWRATDLGQLVLGKVVDAGEAAPANAEPPEAVEPDAKPDEAKPADAKPEDAKPVKPVVIPEVSDELKAVLAEISKGSRSEADLATALKTEVDSLKPQLKKLEELGCVREICRAEHLLEDALARYEVVLVDHPTLLDSDESKELVMVAYLYWNDIIELNDPTVSEENRFPKVRPFAALWKKEQGRMPQIRVLYDRETRSR